jgi:hypothetical protein
MRIDAKETIGPFPKLLVRTALRRLRSRLQFGLADLEAAASLEPGDGRVLLGALRSEGLVEEAGRDVWTITQAGQTFFFGDGGTASLAGDCGESSAAIP